MVLNSMVPVFLFLLLETSLGSEDNTCVTQPNPRLQAVCPDSSPGQLLCINTTYIYECRVQQNALRWRVISEAQSSVVASETYSNGSDKNVPTPPENGFVFTLVNKDNGFVSTVHFYTTMNMQADTLECMEIASGDVITTSLAIANPLDAPVVSWESIGDCSYQLTWCAVECARSYVVSLLGCDSNSNVNIGNATSYTVHLSCNEVCTVYVSADGGPPSPGFQLGNDIPANGTSGNGTSGNGTSGNGTSRNDTLRAGPCIAGERGCPGIIRIYQAILAKAGSRITLSDVPPGAEAYYISDLDTTQTDVKLEDNNTFADVYPSGNVTLIVLDSNGTLLYSVMIPDPGSVFNEEWLYTLLAGLPILALIIGMIIGVIIAPIVLLKTDFKKNNSGKSNLSGNELEQKL